MRRLVLPLVLLVSLAFAGSADAAGKKKKPATPPVQPSSESDKSGDAEKNAEADKNGESEKSGDAEKSSDAEKSDDGDKKDAEKPASPGPIPGKVEGADEDLDTVEGIGNCDTFVEKNAHDMQIWEKTQPPVPYKYQERKTFLDAPWTPITKLDADSGMLLLATLAPHINAMVRSATPAIGFSWPWEIPVGPAFWCTRKKGSYDVFKYRPVRLVVEPGLYAEQPVTFWVRPGARFLWHPTAWYFGAGLGAGSTLEIVGKEPFRASLSPEAVVTFGRCCNPGYFTLAVRHDFFFAGRTQTTTASVGFNYF